MEFLQLMTQMFGATVVNSLGFIGPISGVLVSRIYLANPALSALFKVDGALKRVGGENDYIYYAGNHRIHKLLKR